jgi:hypothetical protein
MMIFIFSKYEKVPVPVAIFLTLFTTVPIYFSYFVDKIIRCDYRKSVEIPVQFFCAEFQTIIRILTSLPVRFRDNIIPAPANPETVTFFMVHQ